LSALTCAGVLLVACGRLWVQGISAGKGHPESTIVEKFQSLDALAAKDSRDAVSPLVEQAKAYALYLMPPTPAPAVAPQPRVNTQRAYAPPETTAKFKLWATSYYRASPEKSWALVSEPGNGDRWVKKNDRLGHFIVERVEKGTIFYRDGTQVHEMRVAGVATVQLAQIRSSLSTSSQTIKPDLSLLNGLPPSEVK
jgi:hypothetical protein